MSDLEPGDVVEIGTARGRVYAQVTHDHPSYPSVVRVLEGHFDARPDDLSALVSGESRFTAMIPLESALTRLGREFEKVGSYDVPPAISRFPTFRMPIRDKVGQIVYWWLWDGQGLSYETDLDDAQSKLPLREVMTAKRFGELLDGEGG
ncbi:hypothetical protein [Jiella avicenniae]|uniref:Uncharacterized protein n=1 Tax=Jiella avicenniae TaxID=2907202 RepID=A0A9X1P220_9HYPH|nr:hypothetical protein [Jiella avicenniae]MCE7029955.1 hypothetical protein [Jiella avicenniae]